MRDAVFKHHNTGDAEDPGDTEFALGDLSDVPIWVAWREELKPKEKPSKVPYGPATGRAAKPDDPNTWGTRARAERRAQWLDNERPSGVGIMLGPIPGLDGCRLAGVDLDGCLDDAGELAPWAAAVVERFGSYVERSPSGAGLHVLFLCRESDYESLRAAGLVTPKGGAEFSRGNHVEIALYLGGRYFTVTNNGFGDGAPIRPVDRTTLEWLIREHGPAFKRSVGTRAPKGGDASGSGVAWKLARDLARKGLSEDDARDALAEDDGLAGEWWNRVDDRQRERAIEGAFASVAAERNALVDAFDDLGNDDPRDVAVANILGLSVVEYLERYPTTTEDPVAQMNRRHAVVHLANKVAVATFRDDGRIDFSSESDLHTLYKNRPMGSKTLAAVWMEHKDRRTYRNGIVFDPSARVHREALNLWTGWALQPDSSASCGLILNHIRDVICDGDESHSRYAIGWLADLVQNPGRKPGVALVLKGGKGAGKDTLAVVLAKIIGKRHVAHIDQPERLTQKFNGHFSTAILAHVEEAFWSGDRGKRGSLQALITSPTATLERKGVDPVTVDSFVRLLMTTNEDWAIPATADERRYAVFDVSDSRIGDRAYFEALYREIEGGGPAAFLAYLQGVDLSGFKVQDVPQTRALLEQKLASLHGVGRWWFDVLWRGELPGGPDFTDDDSGWVDGPQDIGRGELRGDYERWIQSQRFQGASVDERTFGKRLREVCPELENTRPWQPEGPRPKGYRIPALWRCRDLFGEALHRDARAIAWDDDQSR